MDDFILLLLMLLLLFVCFFFLFFFFDCFCLFDLCFLLLLACLLMCPFKFVLLLLSLFWLFLFLGAGTWCSYNHLLVSKLVSFGIVYKFVVSQGSLALIRELFIILYVVNIFYQFIVIFHIDCLCLCRCVS